MYGQLAAAIAGPEFADAMNAISKRQESVVTFEGKPIDDELASTIDNNFTNNGWDKPDYDGWFDDDNIHLVPPSYSGGTRVKTWWRFAHVKTGLEIDQRARARDRIFTVRDQPYDKGASHKRSIEQRRIRYCRQHGTFRGNFWPEDLEEPQEDLMYAFVGLT